jgi:simple sugar transport system ATP-binding protein
LAKWLASKPQIMILNGPTVGVDVGSKDELHELMKELADDGMGLLVISDDTRELLKICNRIMLMRNGQITDEINANDITEDELASMLIED